MYDTTGSRSGSGSGTQPGSLSGLVHSRDHYWLFLQWKRVTYFSWKCLHLAEQRVLFTSSFPLNEQ